MTTTPRMVEVKYGFAELYSFVKFEGASLVWYNSFTEYDSSGNIISSKVEPAGVSLSYPKCKPPGLLNRFVRWFAK